MNTTQAQRTIDPEITPWLAAQVAARQEEKRILKAQMQRYAAAVAEAKRTGQPRPLFKDVCEVAR